MPMVGLFSGVRPGSGWTIGEKNGMGYYEFWPRIRPSVTQIRHREYSGRSDHFISQPIGKCAWLFFYGDEFTGQAEPILGRLETINPRKEEGRRHASINAVGFPTVLRYPFMGRTRA
jgi:hypothetical protein